MKRLLYACLLLVFPLAVYADTISINCPSEVGLNNDFTCEVTGNSVIKMMALKTTLVITDGVSITGFIPDSVWEGSLNSTDNKISLYTDDEATGDFKIGVLKLRANALGTNTITLNQVYYYDDEKTYSVAETNKIINITKETSTTNNSDNSTSPSTTDKKDNDNDSVVKTVITSTYLTDIMIENYSLDFEKNTFNYDLTIGNENELKITPMLEDNSSTYVINGNRNLEDGSVIIILVNNQDKSDSKKYIITIHKEKQKQGILQNKNLIFGIIIGVLLIINIVRIISSKKKKVADNK